MYVYENCWRGEGCPEFDRLERKLSAVGFDPEQIQAALLWLDGLSLAAQGTQWLDAPPPLRGALPQQCASSSLRVYSVAEQNHLGADGLGFIAFLEAAGVLPAPMREVVLDRAMAASDQPLTLEALKVIILMVYWSFGEEPDALILDELCTHDDLRVAH